MAFVAGVLVGRYLFIWWARDLIAETNDLRAEVFWRRLWARTQPTPVSPYHHYSVSVTGSGSAKSH